MFKDLAVDTAGSQTKGMRYSVRLACHAAPVHLCSETGDFLILQILMLTASPSLICTLPAVQAQSTAAYLSASNIGVKYFKWLTYLPR